MAQRVGFAMVAVLCLLSPLAAAQDLSSTPSGAPPPGDAPSELDLFQLDTQIQKVEIAARREQDQRETAANTVVITAADLEAYG